MEVAAVKVGNRGCQEKTSLPADTLGGGAPPILYCPGCCCGIEFWAIPMPGGRTWNVRIRICHMGWHCLLDQCGGMTEGTGGVCETAAAAAAARAACCILCLWHSRRDENKG